MAVLPMKKIRVIGLKKNRKTILEAIQRNGTVEVYEENINDSGFFKKETAASQNIFSKAISDFNEALNILNIYSQESSSLLSSLNGRKAISKKEYYSFIEESEQLSLQAKNVINNYKGIAEKKAEIIKLETKIDSLSPWCNLNIPLSFKGTKKTAAFIGTFPDKRSYETIYSDFSSVSTDENISIDIKILNSTPEQTYVFIICHKNDAVKAEEILRNLGFSKPAVSSDIPPCEMIENLKKQRDILNSKILASQDELKKSIYLINPFKFMIDYYNMRIDKYIALSKVNQHNHIFLLSGYLPQKDTAALENLLVSEYEAAVEISDITENDNPGVILKNNSFSEGCEGVVESFSLPSKNEGDPTSIMSIFYYVLFGIMLSDAAYGAIIALGCFFALKNFKNMELPMRKTLKMYMICGISTVFWGVMFGSYFGDAPSVIAKTFFNKNFVIPPLWFTPSEYAMDMLLFSFLMGITHLFAGLGVKMVSLIKDKKPLDAFFDVISWYMLISGAVVYLMSTKVFIDMVGLRFTLPSIIGKIAAFSAIAGAVIIIFTAGRSSGKFFIRIAKGLYELYGATSYLSDILSYSRLLALGLATGVIATVFNKMGSMLGGGIFGAIFFIVVFIVGHALNLAINLLGAYVHTNRLQFVEFFGKFYEGGGKKHEPFSVKTKYYKIKEEI